jgi:hypothetical protein
MKFLTIRFWKSSVSLSFCFLLVTACNDSASIASPMESFTGAHTRVTWVQEQGNGADTYGFGENFKLMGYDSRDGKKERELLKDVQNFYKPIFTPDGKKVIVSSRSRHEIYMVDFRKGKKKLLGKGVAVDVWKDPETGKTWVYALAGNGPENKYFTTRPLIRFLLKKPDKRETVWTQTHLSWSNFDMSRDGKFAGGLFPWPHAGILLFEQNIWKKYGKGCWTALSPDNSAILWVFDGLHRNLNFVNPFTAEFWTTNINTADGVGGFEVYHPRWSNHVRYLTMTGPYVEGEGGNKITGGGQKVEVYVGKFSPDLKSVEGWFQVTHNDRADFYPDVWIANGYESKFALAGTREIPIAAHGENLDWPGKSDKLVFLWQDVMAENKLAEDSLLGFSQFRVTPEQRARFNRFLEMDLNGAGFKATLPGDKVLAALQKEDGLGLEFLYTPVDASLKQNGSVISLRDNNNHKVIDVLQKAKGLFLKVFADNKLIASVDLPDALQANRPEHLFIDIKGKQLKLYTNGKLQKERPINGNPIQSLDGVGLLLGNPDATDSGLNGALSHVAVYAGSSPSSDIAQKAHMVTGDIEARKSVQTIQIKGTLTEVSAIPAPDSLGAYRRALVVNRYMVDSVIAGEYFEREILIAQWAVLDRLVLPETKGFQIDKSMELKVEKFDQHPELEGERLMMDMFDPDLDLYYQVGS